MYPRLGNQTCEWYDTCPACEAEVERVATGNDLVKEDGNRCVMAYYPSVLCPACAEWLEPDAREVTDWWNLILEGFHDPRA